ncbi:SLBB domain-containing protein [Candidatus Cloacimonadota bacterium]
MFSKYIRILLIVSFGLISWCLQAQMPEFSTDMMMYQVSLVGAVDNPGVFMVPVSTRVSEVIRLSEAENITEQLKLRNPSTLVPEEVDLFQERYKEHIFDPEAETTINGSSRNIILKRKNQEIKIDLQKFFLLGLDEFNPYIMDGDVIFVPAMGSAVELFGAVNIEGAVELVENDRISDIIELSLGLKENANLHEIELVRYVNNSESETIMVDLEKAYSNPESKDNILLQSDDRIYVRMIPQYHENNYVNLAGEVELPGLYPIEENKTTLLDVLMQCGEIAENADLSKAFVQRIDPELDFDPEFERLKLVPPINMAYLEYSYFKQKSRELRAMFSVDIQKLWETKEEKYDIVLRNQDFIYIPQKTNTVFVSGQVENPGYVIIEPGQSFEYYIQKAGGFSQNARKFKIRVIKSESGNWVKPNSELVLEDGDVIFVPEKSEYDYLKITKDVLVILSQIATIFIGVQTLTQ